MTTLPQHKRADILYIFKLVLFSSLPFSSSLTTLDSCFPTTNSSSGSSYLLSFQPGSFLLRLTPSSCQSLSGLCSSITRESPFLITAMKTIPLHRHISCSCNEYKICNEDIRYKIVSTLPPTRTQALRLQALCFVPYHPSNSSTEPITLHT